MAFKMVSETGPQATNIMFVWIQILTDKGLNPSSHTPVILPQVRYGWILDHSSDLQPCVAQVSQWDSDFL